MEALVFSPQVHTCHSYWPPLCPDAPPSLDSAYAKRRPYPLLFTFRGDQAAAYFGWRITLVCTEGCPPWPPWKSGVRSVNIHADDGHTAFQAGRNQAAVPTITATEYVPLSGKSTQHMSTCEVRAADQLVMS